MKKPKKIKNVAPASEGVESITTASKLKRIVVWAFMALGVLQVYNIISHRQDLLDLSESVKLVGAWWRYLISLPFGWIHWHLSPAKRELLVLLLFFGSAANLSYYRQQGKWMWTEFAFWREDADEEAESDPTSSLTTLDMATALLFLVGIIGALIYIVWPYYWLLIVFVIGYFVLKNASTLIEAPFPLDALVMLVTAIIYFIVTWVATVARNGPSILRSLRYLLLLLTADWGARFIIDPLAHALPSISYPPPIAF